MIALIHQSFGIPAILPRNLRPSRFVESIGVALLQCWQHNSSQRNNLVRNFMMRREPAIKAILKALVFGTLAALGFHDISPHARPWYVLAAVLFIYGRIARAGLFSVYDVVGWLSNLKLKSVCKRDPSFVWTKADTKCSQDQPEKIGVVFPGGGGKGAYQLGCWRELKRRGVAVHAVSGSSVGSLNIAMLSSGNVSDAESIWSRLSASQLMNLDLSTLPLMLLYLARWKRRYALNKGFWWFSFLLVTLILLILFGFGTWKVVNSGIFIDRESPWTSHYSLVVALPFAMVMFSAILAFVPILWERGPLRVMGGVFYTHRLRSLIESVVNVGSFTNQPMTCFATVAHEAVVVDSFDANQFIIRKKAGGAKQVLRVRPRIAYRPLYLNLGHVEKSGIDAVHGILQLSSAIPYIFSSIRVGDQWLFDGGVADNVPITPLLEHGCTRIFVLHLNTLGLDTVDGKSCEILTREGLLGKLQKIEYVKRLWSYSANYTERIKQGKYEEVARIWSLRPVEWPKHVRLTADIIHVVPSADLGGFLSGTLNFTGQKARWLIERGEMDMKYVLDRLEEGACGKQSPSA